MHDLEHDLPRVGELEVESTGIGRQDVECPDLTDQVHLRAHRPAGSHVRSVNENVNERQAVHSKYVCLMAVEKARLNRLDDDLDCHRAKSVTEKLAGV